MRILKISALAFACAVGGLTLSQANAEPQPARGPQSWIDRMCSNEPKGDRMAAFMEKRVERLSTILQLTDAQKATLKEMEDARAKQRADSRTALCANKPDLSTFPARLAFREQMMQRRLDGFKAMEPKILAFYNSLNDKQKAAFEQMREGMMMGMRERMMRHHGGPGGMGGMGGMGGKGGAGPMGGPEDGSPEE